MAALVLYHGNNVTTKINYNKIVCRPDYHKIIVFQVSLLLKHALQKYKNDPILTQTQGRN